MSPAIVLIVAYRPRAQLYRRPKVTVGLVRMDAKNTGTDAMKMSDWRQRRFETHETTK